MSFVPCTISLNTFLAVMPLYRKLFMRTNYILRRYSSTKQNALVVELEQDVNDKIAHNEMRPKQHPGVMPDKRFALPTDLVEYVKMALGDIPVKNIMQDSGRLTNYLKSRHPPAEKWELRRKLEEVNSSLGTPNIEGESDDKTEKIIALHNRKLKAIMSKKVYRWKPVSYDKYMSLQYLVGRAAPEYAVLMKIFNEIKTRVEDFHPKSFFDFGSGVGTGTWAARECWGHSIDEYFTVDTSSDMNYLARFILSEGRDSGDIPIKKFFQREFLPSNPLPYNVVLSAYSLFELPSMETRLRTVQTLWKKTTDFLILVEHGTNAGFALLNEARDFILDIKEGPLVGHVFAPCPHDTICPRYVEDNTPCNFEVSYLALQLSERFHHHKELYSYVILRKSIRDDNSNSWPRIVRPVIRKSKRSICRMCCNDGSLKEVIFTSRRHGKQTYECGKFSSWGDLMPLNIGEMKPDDEPPAE